MFCSFLLITFPLEWILCVNVCRLVKWRGVEVFSTGVSSVWNVCRLVKCGVNSVCECVQACQVEWILCVNVCRLVKWSGVEVPLLQKVSGRSMMQSKWMMNWSVTHHHLIIVVSTTQQRFTCYIQWIKIKQRKMELDKRRMLQTRISKSANRWVFIWRQNAECKSVFQR